MPLKQDGRWIPGGALSALALLPRAGRTRVLMCLIPTDPSPLMTTAPFSRVYGVPLRTHLQELGRDIALPIEACVLLLLSECMQEEVGAEAWGWWQGPKLPPRAGTHSSPPREAYLFIVGPTASLNGKRFRGLPLYYRF